MIQQVIFIALSVYFIHACFWPTMIFGKLAQDADTWMPEWAKKPLYDCPICMTVWWGWALYWFYYYIDVPIFPEYEAQLIIPVLMCAAGMNTILLQLNRIADTLKNWYEDHSEPKDSEDN